MSETGSSKPVSKAATDYDIVVIGGAFSGAAAALLIQKQAPESRILVVESSDQFPHKVGEATVELSAHFLGRVLGLGDHLKSSHLPKHGLRYWFTDGPDRRIDEMSEIGPKSPPDLPSFQLDRSKLDQHLLEQAEAEGVEVVRPARVKAVESGWPVSRVSIEDSGSSGGTARDITTRWVIDASGRHAFLARRLRLLKRTERHPIAACWGRWRSVVDLDGSKKEGSDGSVGSVGAQPALGLPPVGAKRRLATNHFCGDGWWCWVIPLACGKTSIGWVYNKEMVDPGGEATAAERYLRFVRTQPGLRDLVADAEPCEGDVHSYTHLSYRTSQYADRGWALIGDAASFLDPYYSPGLDHASISVYATAGLIASDLRGDLSAGELETRIANHNRDFARSYERWLDALYTGKYRLLGDAELVTCAFLVDTSLYYLGVLTPILRNLEALGNPVFGVELPQATWAYRLTRLFNRRLQRLSELRRRSGRFGRRNVGWRLYVKPFGIGSGSVLPLLRGLGLWAKMEAQQVLWNLLPDRSRDRDLGELPGGRAAAPEPQSDPSSPW